MIAKLLGVRIFDLEASGFCNLRCSFCPRHLLPPEGMMSEETFGKFLDHTPLGAADTVSFVGLGEPTLNPRLSDFIRETKRRYPKARTWVTTNGTTLTDRVLQPLLCVGLDTLDVSFNGLDAVAYEKEMNGAKFDKTLANVEHAARELKRLGVKTQLQINYLVTKENSADEERIQTFWRARGVNNFRPQRMHDRAGTHSVAGLTPEGAPGLRGRSCAVFETVTFVTWQGDVTYCCHDMPRRHKIGNVREDDWAVIESRKKQIIRKGVWPAMCGACTDPLRHDMLEKVDQMIQREIREQAAAGLRSSFRRLRDIVGV